MATKAADIKKQVKKLLKVFPVIGPVLRQSDALRRFQAYDPGHYYSPIPHPDDVKRDEGRIFERTSRSLPGIDIGEERQLQLFIELSRYYVDLPFKATRTEGLRYYFENAHYSYSDAIILYSMIRHLKPKRILEVGSGCSSCVILDTNELFCGNSIVCSFVEPFPERLLSLIKKGDHTNIRIFRERVQDISLDQFRELGSRDILFVDSTHVSKVGSDVNYIVHEVLPHLRDGVYVHFHDIFYPFEYPKRWVYEGKAWNEAYILRAFLEYNERFEIVFFNTFLELFHEDRFEKEMPLCMKNRGGSLWLRKRGKSDGMDGLGSKVGS